MILRERYPAVVKDNSDPEKRGRIMVTCPGLMGDDKTVLPFWVEPSFDWGVFIVPDLEEVVEIEAVVHDDQSESKDQAFLEEPDIRWRGKRFYSTNAPPNPEFTGSNYGKLRGFATPTGHVLLFDDTPGAEKIRLAWRDADDKVQAIEIVDNKATFKIDAGATIEITGKDAATTTILGDGGVKAAIADHLQTLWGSLKTALDIFGVHVHGGVTTGPGSSGPPVPTLTAPAWNVAINSNKLKFPDG